MAADGPRAGESLDGLVDRVEAIAVWINDLDSRVRTAEVATGDEKTARELRRAIEALSKHDPKLEKRLTNRVDVLADRLATLASTVSTTAAALARKDGEIAALRKGLEEDTKRVEALARDREKDGSAAEIEKLRSAVRAVQAERPARTSDARLDGIGTKIDFLTERIDTLGKTVATTAAGLVGREGDIATLRHQLEERSAEIERMATELRRMQGDSGLTHRLDELQVVVKATTAGLATRESEATALKARIDEAYSRVGTAFTELQGSIATLGAQVQALEDLPDATEQALAAQAHEFDGRVDTIQTRLDELATGIASALGGLEERATEAVSITQRVDEASAHVDGVVAELRQALDRLPAPGSVDPEVERRLAELAASVATTADSLAAIEASSAAQVEGAAARADAVEQLVAAAAERLEAAEREREEGAERMRGELDALASARAEAEKAQGSVGPLLDEARDRLDALEGAHAAATAEIVRVSAALEAEQAAAHTRVEALAAMLAQTAEAATAGEGAARLVDELGARVRSVEEKENAAEAEIVRVSSAVEAAREQLDALAAALAEAGTESAIRELGDRLQLVEGKEMTSEAGIARMSVELRAEREALRAELDALAASLADAEAPSAGVEGAQRALGELGMRLQIVEERGALSASEIARVSASLEAERASLRAQVDALAAAVAQADGSRQGDEDSAQMLSDLAARLRAVEERSATAVAVSNPDAERLAGELSERLDEMERDRQAMVAELARLHASEAARATLDARVGELAAQLARVELGAPAAAPAAAGDEVVQLRVAVEGLRMRLASNEQELATVVGTRDAAARLDEVTRRLEALERAPVALAGAADGGPAAGDGRFRLELRALELRMEHAEAAARENREAVLVQLERLAARIEWRFQRLEAEYEAGQPEAIGGGQVVPIRPPDTQK
jgi:chromosome segregation ATPase